MTAPRVAMAGVLICLILFPIGWLSRQDPAEIPYLKVLGGGFIFNYREAEVFYGFTAEIEKPLATGSIVEVTFENPAGGAPFVISKRVDARTTRYAFRTPPVHGVVAKKPYHVVMKIYDRQRQDIIWTAEKVFRSEISDAVVPKKPLTIGPGYTVNPDR